MQGETLKGNAQPPLCGSWRLEREIGRGAYGVVYLAVAPDGERAAVKAVRRTSVGDERYARELRGARLYHAVPQQEGLVRMRALVEAEWGFYAVMDLADDEFGGTSGSAADYRPKTLAGVVKGEKALPLKECVSLAVSLARGLVALQRHHLLHRDIKPANVLYVHGRPVLSDPGLVVEESDAVSLVGTPGYVPPEKFTAAASDIYSFCLTLKAASFGRPIEDIDKGPALEADTGAPLFTSWWRILNKATDPVPSRRYQSAKALLKEFESLRRKMSVSSVLHSWMFYAAVGVLVSSLGAYAYIDSLEKNRLAGELKAASREQIRLEGELGLASREIKRLESEMAPMKKILDIANALNENTSKDSLVWSSFKGSYFCHTDESHRQRLKRAQRTDPALASKMQAVLDKMVEIDKKGEENNRQIKALHDEAKAGQDAAKRYNQAEMLSMENEKLVRAWLSLLEQFTVLEDEVKAKDR